MEIARRMVEEGNINAQRAAALLDELRNQ
jgi:polyhydroxyalkanoate synthesis regulator phasin